MNETISPAGVALHEALASSCFVLAWRASTVKAFIADAKGGKLAPSQQEQQADPWGQGQQQQQEQQADPYGLGIG